MVSVEFLITSLVVVLIPGTGVLYTVSTGLFLGSRATVWASLGCTFGIVLPCSPVSPALHYPSYQCHCLSGC